MQKSNLIKISLSIIVILFTFLFSSCSSNEYKEYADDESKQVALILRKNGCVDCHAENAPIPFYGKLPIISSVVKADIVEGTNYIDFTSLLYSLDNGLPVSEVDMAKVEHTALSGSMPPMKYYAMPMHWGKTFDSEERAILINWSKNVRKTQYTSPTVASEFANEPLQPLPDFLPVDSAKVELGYRLYHDTRLSADNSVSCATCHDLATGGVDRLQYSKGING